jgi:CheY-like chemotaxis protein
VETPETIVAVDDDADFRHALRTFLGAVGYEVVLARDGREGLEALHRHPNASLVLLDLEMPGLDGRRFREEQAQDSAIADVPVLVLSGGDDAAAVAREIGADEFARKPVTGSALLELVRRHIRA